MTTTNRRGDRGSPCLSPLELLKKPDGEPLTKTEKHTEEMQCEIQETHFSTLSYFIFMSPKQFWSDVLTACYLINRMHSSILDGASPHSLKLSSSSQFFLPLKAFGCVCYVHNLGPGSDKLDPPATKFLFLGYSTTSVNVTFLESILNFLLLLLWVTLRLSLTSCLFCSQFHPYLSPASPSQQVLLHPRSPAPLQVYMRQLRPSRNTELFGFSKLTQLVSVYSII
jgi:hypothetical protein